MTADNPYYPRPEFQYQANLRNAAAFRENFDRIKKDHWKCPAGVRNATGDAVCWHCKAPRPSQPPRP